jgi:methylamine utilization protein MauE
MNRRKLLHFLAAISRYGLAALFLFTAGAKFWIVGAFAESVKELLAASGINPIPWMWPVTVTVITVEILTAILLLLRRIVRAGALLAAALLIAFSAFAMYYVYVLHGEPLECGCFGKIIASQLGLTTALRNLALLVPTFLVFFGYRQPRQSRIMDYEQVSVTS